jgi:hypothetical protein
MKAKFKSSEGLEIGFGLLNFSVGRSGLTPVDVAVSG